MEYTSSKLLEEGDRQYLRRYTISARIVTEADARLQISLDPILLAKSINEDKHQTLEHSVSRFDSEMELIIN